MQGNEVWVNVIVAVVAAVGTLWAGRMTASSNAQTATINNYSELVEQLNKSIDKNTELNNQIIELREQLSRSNTQIEKLNNLVEQLTGGKKIED